MVSEIPVISNNTVKDLNNFYLHLKNKQHPAIKAHPGKDKPTVLIIGAGLSGLTAAKELTRHGLNVVLIEARDRIGGRIHSLQLEDGSFIEMGAQFVHGVKNNPLYALSEQYRLEVKPYVRSNWALFDMQGNEIDKTALNDLVEQYQEHFKTLNQTRQSDDKDRFTVSELEYIDKQILKQKAISSGNLSTLAKMISIKELKKEKLFSYKLGLTKKESESNFLVINGYYKITQGLHAQAKETGLLHTFLSHQVLKIEHTADEIIVHSKTGGVHRADAAICTLPLGVLQQGSVIFDPPLPSAKTKAINALQCATHNKVILQFEDVFWDDYSHFVVLYDSTLEAWLDIVNLQHFTNNKTPLLVASIYSSPNKELPEDKYLVNHCVNLFKDIYPTTFRPLKKSWVTHWDKDPFSLGSYSYHPQGSTLDDNSAIAKPIGRLVFAGEHTHRSPANLQAAYLSGLESAKQAIEQLLFIYQSVAKR